MHTNAMHRSSENEVLLARLRAICKVTVSQSFSDIDLVRLAWACTTNAPMDTVCMLFNRSISHSMKNIAHKLALTDQEFGQLFAVDAQTERHSLLAKHEEFKEQLDKLEQSLRSTLRHAPIQALWSNANRRAAAVLAMHTTTPTLMIGSVIGFVLDSDTRWVEDLAAEIEADWQESGPSPVVAIDLLDTLMHRWQ